MSVLTVSANTNCTTHTYFCHLHVLAVFGHHQVYFMIAYMEKIYRDGDIDFVESIRQNNLQPTPVEMFYNCSLIKYIYYTVSRHNLDLSRAKFHIPGRNP
jgi:hypothetical protein